jgi:hypothetical protein
MYFFAVRKTGVYCGFMQAAAPVNFFNNIPAPRMSVVITLMPAVEGAET